MVQQNRISPDCRVKGPHDELVSNPIKEPKKHAHAIHNLQRQWQLLDISGKSASKNQWNKFNDLSNKAWESCKDYFEEIKQIKINNAEKKLFSSKNT